MYNNDVKERNKLLKEIEKVRNHIIELVTEDILTVREQKALFQMFRTVNENVTAKYPELQKEVVEVMGGRVLELEYDKEMREAEARGEASGARQKAIRIAKNLMKLNLPLDVIADTSELSLDEVEKLAAGQTI